MEGDERSIFSKALDWKPLFLKKIQIKKNPGCPNKEYRTICDQTLKKNLHWSMIEKILLHNGKNLMGLGVPIRIGTFPVEPLLGAWPGIGNQSCCNAPVGLLVRIAERRWLKSGGWGCCPDNGPEMTVGQPNRS